MRHSTRSLTIALATAAAVAATPLVLEYWELSPAGDPAAATSEVAADVAPPGPIDSPPGQPVAARVDAASAGAERSVFVPGPAPVPAQAEDAPVASGQGSSLPGRDSDGPGSGMGGDLPPEALPSPPYPQCPITGAGAWWTDPADPYTCIPPGSLPFHEPTPPGIPPELLEPIFEQPVTPGPDEDCRLVGALQCTVTIMGQDYVVTFAEGRPVGVAEAR
jgi:hypothetical protein